MPPLSVRPATPVSEISPPGVARPKTCVFVGTRPKPSPSPEKPSPEPRPSPEPSAPEIRVGLMGLGQMGLGAIKGLAPHGYKLRGWSRSQHKIDGVDCYAGAAWPERFDRDELQKRRRETRTLNEWDSQYQLQSKPVTQVRLDPARIVPYDVAPVFRYANGELVLWLGRVRIVGAACRWDPSSGKLKSDVSGVAVVLQDDAGRRYLHAIEGVTGEVAEFAQDGKTIVGGQVRQICDLVDRLKLPRVSVETNGIGGFAPTVLRAALKQRAHASCVNHRLACIHASWILPGTNGGSFYRTP